MAAEAQPLRVLRENRAFRIYFVGQTISMLGAWMQQVALAWVVVSLTDSKAAIGTIAFVASLPLILLTMPAGLVVDRGDRRKILIASQVALAVVALGYAALLHFNALSLFLLYVLAICNGAIVAFDLPAMQALVPELVPRADIASAVALNQSLFHGTRLVGPAIAGVLMAATSPVATFLANGLSFLAVIYSLMLIRTPPRTTDSARKKGALGEGWRYIRKNPVVAALVGYAALNTTFVFPFLVIFSAVYLKTIVGGGELALGVLFSVSGAGALLGALAQLRVPGELRGRAILAAAGINAVSLAVVALAPDVVTALVAVSFLAFGVAAGLGLGSTTVQILVPPELRGRVMAIHGMMFTGLMPTAALAIGFVADKIGLRQTLGGMAAIFAAATVFWLTRAGLHHRRDLTVFSEEALP